MHLAFTPQTIKGSYFFTDNEKIQQALETHPLFQKRFFIDEAFQRKEEAKTIKQQKVTEEKEEQKAPKTINVKCLQDAKDYLADNYNVSRTKIRNTASVIKEATKHNIIFKGI